MEQTLNGHLSRRRHLELLIADTLAGTREMLPSDLMRSERQPADPPEVVEIWFA